MSDDLIIAPYLSERGDEGVQGKYYYTKFLEWESSVSGKSSLLEWAILELPMAIGISDKQKLLDIPYSYTIISDLQALKGVLKEQSLSLDRFVPLNILDSSASPDIRVSLTTSLLHIADLAVENLFGDQKPFMTFIDVADENYALIFVPTTREAYERLEEVSQEASRLVEETLLEYTRKAFNTGFTVKSGSYVQGSGRRLSWKRRITIVSRLLAEPLSDYVSDRLALWYETGGFSFISKYLDENDFKTAPGTLRVRVRNKSAALGISVGYLRKLSFRIYPSLVNPLSFLMPMDPKSMFFAMPEGLSLDRILDQVSSGKLPVLTLHEVIDDLLQSGFSESEVIEALNNLKEYKVGLRTLDGLKIKKFLGFVEKPEGPIYHGGMSKRYSLRNVFAIPREYLLLVRATSRRGGIVDRIIPASMIFVRPTFDMMHGKLDAFVKSVKNVLNRLSFAHRTLSEIDHVMFASKKRSELTIDYGPYRIYTPNRIYNKTIMLSLAEVFDALRLPYDEGKQKLLNAVINASTNYVCGSEIRNPKDQMIKHEDVKGNVLKVLKKLREYGPFKPAEGEKSLIVVPLLLYSNLEDIESLRETLTERWNVMWNLMTDVLEVLRDVSGTNRTLSVMNVREVVVPVLRRGKKRDDDKEAIEAAREMFSRLHELAKEINEVVASKGDSAVLIVAIESPRVEAHSDEDKTRVTMGSRRIDYKRVLEYFLVNQNVPAARQFLRVNREFMKALEKSKEKGNPAETHARLRSIIIQLARKVDKGAITLAPIENPAYPKLLEVMENPYLVSSEDFRAELNDLKAMFERLYATRDLRVDYVNVIFFANLIRPRNILLDALKMETEDVEEEVDREELERELRHKGDVLLLGALLPNGELIVRTARISHKSPENTVSEIVERLTRDIVTSLIKRLRKKGLDVKRSGRGSVKVRNAILFIFSPDIERITTYKNTITPTIVKTLKMELDSKSSENVGGSMRILTYLVRPEDDVVRLVQLKRGEPKVDVYRSAVMYAMTPRHVVIQNTIGIRPEEGGFARTYSLQYLPDRSILLPDDPHGYDLFRSILGAYITTLLSHYTIQNITALKLPFFLYSRNEIARRLVKFFGSRRSVVTAAKKVGVQDLLDIPAKDSKEFRKIVTDRFVEFLESMTKDLGRWI